MNARGGHIVQHEPVLALQAPQHVRGKPRIVGLPQIHAVQMRELGIIHAACRAPHGIDVEQLNGFVARQDFAVAMPPAQPQQIIAQSFRQKAGALEFQHAHGAVPLAELGAVRPVD